NSWKQNGTVLVSFGGQRIEEAKETAVRAEISYIDGSGKEELIETILLSGEEAAAAAARLDDDEADSSEPEGEEDFLADEESFFEETEICFEATHFSVYRLTFVERRTTETGNLDAYLLEDTVSPADAELNLFHYVTEDEEENPGSGNGSGNSKNPLQDLLDPDTELNDASLQQLFDPNLNVKGKTSHEDVKGLFQKDGKSNYYYSSKIEYAVYDTEENTFRLYSGAAEIGGTAQFLPFTPAEDVFEEADSALQVRQGFNLSEIKYNTGLSLKVDFYQPDGGKVETGEGDKEPMVFQLSGDDVWVYVDGVSVVNSGGNWTINFATGVISNGDGISDSLQEKFKNANESADFSDDGTFQNGTLHTLEFFYLGRGEQAVPLSLSYNVVYPKAEHTVVVLDQDNQPMEGAEFELYRADESYETSGKPLAVFTTDESGICMLVDESGAPYDFKGCYEADRDQKKYVLKETKTPEGYRPVPDILLEYDPEDNILKVMNPWTTGAVGNFSAEVYRMGETLKYQNEDGQGASQEITPEEAEKGIVLAVPMTMVDRNADDAYSAGNWRPIYGTNLETFVMADTDKLVEPDTKTGRKRMLKAALYQIHASQNDPEHYQSWYLSWSD
ncbi:MAG: hypothetical protein Q4C73_12415, partial [Eubacteriales bacterium]|nr:hypothetical protein [Eubacteriales bacterium]